ncbi:hypothetical protein B425_2710 [Bacillus amyloliquefaciens]|nr:hypothetical protein BAMTA208_06955 [Bacillus amyloliquefaciens TA208]AEB63751.1 hypothetical protein LL3_02214 [Bacillus amyloliquefaciens LL3]KYC95855.1 hypothetical protein B425_2710 [Bacillus amyloliquefaciens]
MTGVSIPITTFFMNGSSIIERFVIQKGQFAMKMAGQRNPSFKPRAYIQEKSGNLYVKR